MPPCPRCTWPTPVPDENSTNPKARTTKATDISSQAEIAEKLADECEEDAISSTEDRTSMPRRDDEDPSMSPMPRTVATREETRSSSVYLSSSPTTRSTAPTATTSSGNV